MSDNQIHIPAAFIDIYTEPGRSKPRLGADELLERFELCDNLAASLCPTASEVLVKLGITEDDVQHKLLQGVMATALGLTPTEALWVVYRTAETLAWPLSAGLAQSLDDSARAWAARQFMARP